MDQYGRYRGTNDSRILDRDRRDYGFDSRVYDRNPDLDRRSYVNPEEYENARRVGDRVSQIVNRGQNVIPAMHSPVPSRPTPYDRHDYRPVLQNIPTIKKLTCKNCHGSKELFICCYSAPRIDDIPLPIIYCSASCQRMDFDSHKQHCMQETNGRFKQTIDEVKERTKELELQIRAHNIRDNQKLKDLEKVEKEKKEKEIEIKKLLAHNKNLIADKKAAVEEAKRNQVIKDKQDLIVEQIKLRIAKNTEQDKKIDSDHREIQSMKTYIQNLMDRYGETKAEKDKQIKELENELENLKKSKETPTSSKS